MIYRGRACCNDETVMNCCLSEATVSKPNSAILLKRQKLHLHVPARAQHVFGHVHRHVCVCPLDPARREGFPHAPRQADGRHVKNGGSIEGAVRRYLM